LYVHMCVFMYICYVGRECGGNSVVGGCNIYMKVYIHIHIHTYIHTHRYFPFAVPRGCCCMWLLLVRQQGRLDSLCLVRLVNDVPGSVYTKLRDPPFVFPFSFCCFGWWLRAVAAALENGWAFTGCVRGAWCMKGKKGACKFSNHPFNF